MDYGVENMVTLNKQCKFPWLMANVLDKKTGQPLGEAGKSVMIKWQGRKVGIVGLVEEEWIATLGTINPEDVTYVDFVTEGRRLARELKEQGAELLIALTHMRVPNDIKLAEEVEEFDIIAGGHDHHVEARAARSVAPPLPACPPAALLARSQRSPRVPAAAPRAPLLTILWRRNARGARTPRPVAFFFI